MGLFDFLKRPASEMKAAPSAVAASWDAGVVCSPVTGEAMRLSESPDPVFSSGSMGEGVAVRPFEDVAYSPVTGTVSAAMAHAVGIVANDGAEVLVHVGVDTVEMGGKGLRCLVSQGSHVNAGDPIVSFSRKRIAEAGKSDIIFVVVTNSDDYAEVTPTVTGPVQAGDMIAKLIK